LSDANRHLLEFLAARFSIVLHGVGLSLGSVRPPTPDFLSAVREMAEITKAPFFSEHVSISRSGGLDLWHLSPVPRTSKSLEAISNRILNAQEQLTLPIIVETITVPFEFKFGEFGWGDFHRAIYERTGAELLVDITNIVVNSINGVGPGVADALDSLEGIPWRQVHVVGYTKDHQGWAVDSHDAAIDDDLLHAFGLLLQRQRPDYVIIERDGRREYFEEVLKDLARLHRLVN
jgi:uncharacterized protein (UPF0276 family)